MIGKMLTLYPNRFLRRSAGKSPPRNAGRSLYRSVTRCPRRSAGRFVNSLSNLMMLIGVISHSWYPGAPPEMLGWAEGALPWQNGVPAIFAQFMVSISYVKSGEIGAEGVRPWDEKEGSEKVVIATSDFQDWTWPVVLSCSLVQNILPMTTFAK